MAQTSKGGGTVWLVQMPHWHLGFCVKCLLFVLGGTVPAAGALIAQGHVWAALLVGVAAYVLRRGFSAECEDRVLYLRFWFIESRVSVSEIAGSELRLGPSPAPRSPVLDVRLRSGGRIRFRAATRDLERLHGQIEKLLVDFQAAARANEAASSPTPS